MTDALIALIERVKVHEGLRLKPYRCTAGKLTIGYGRNLEDRGISEEEARRFLERDLHEAWGLAKVWLIDQTSELDANEIMVLIGRVEQIERELPAIYGVLAELAFWLGRGTLGKFKRLREAVLDFRFDDAAAELLFADEAHTIPSKLHTQAPRRTERLAEIIRKGTL